MIFKVLRHIVTDGADRAVLLSSHDPRACDYVDRVLDMEDGVLEEV
jgi:putative ABC transport system ATP-binding protein